MSGLMQLLRDNPGAFIVTTLLVLGTLVLSLVAFMMMRSGASLRPIIFVGGFFLIVIGPQALFHFSQALGWIPKKDLTWVFGENNAQQGAPWQAREELLNVKDGRFAQPLQVYGSSVDPDLISDLRERLANVFGAAQAAEMAVLRTGATVIMAQFSNATDARQAADAYSMAMLGAAPPFDADGTRTVPRANDVIKMVVAGKTLAAYSAADTAAASKALAASPVIARAAATPEAAAADTFWLYRIPTLVALTLVLMFCAVLWFFRVSMWASEVMPATNVSPVASATLRERLLAVNELDVPFTITPSPDDPDLFVATWRYADAKWVDLARARGIRRTHRILMRIDEATNTVRPLDQLSIIDWSAGKSGGSFRWVTQRSITFYQVEYERVFGLQLDSNFRFTKNLSYSYTFNLQEMKAPLIQAVTQSGWRWRPTFLRGPRWLWWLTQ